MARVRDFIYFDVERVRSLVSQLDEGVVDSLSNSLGRSSSAKGEVKGGVLGLASGGVGVDQLWRSDSEESRSLNDFIFTRLEDLLLSEQLVSEIAPSEEQGAEIELRARLKPTDFLIIDSNVELNDLARMNLLIKKFNEIGRFLAWLGLQQEGGPKVTDSQLSKALGGASSGLQLDKNMQIGLSLMIENLIGEQTLIRCMPFRGDRAASFVGVLDPSCLREKMSAILTKFGSRPAERWKVFCQIASLNPHGLSESHEGQGGEGIGSALRNMFRAIRVLDKTAVPYAPADVTITPIAIYREG